MAGNNNEAMMADAIEANTEKPENKAASTTDKEETVVALKEETDNAKSPESKPGHQPVQSLNMEHPKIFSIPDNEEYAKRTKFCNKDVYIRMSRWLFIAVLPIIFLFVLTHEEVNLALLIGIAVQLMYVTYFGIIGYLFYSGSRKSKNRYLFRVWTRSEAVPGWANMSIATHQQLYQFEAIQSISEFSAVDGGIPSFMLSNLGPFTWAVVTMHFASELACNSAVFHWDIADYCEIFGVCGLVMIGIFELDPYNPPMKFFHYVGAGSGVGTIAGYFIQQYSLSKERGYITLVPPIAISLIAGTCFILWQWSNKQTDKYQDGLRATYKDGRKPTEEEMQAIKQRITMLSLRNVTTEGIFLFCGATSLALWLMHYDLDCDFGCAGKLPSPTPAPTCS